MKFSLSAFLLLSVFSTVAQQNDTLVITKSIYSYGCLTVPETKTWKIKQVTASFGGYSIIANCIKIKTRYESGEQICSPTYCADADLIKGAKDSESNLIYRFEIYEY